MATITVSKIFMNSIIKKTFDPDIEKRDPRTREAIYKAVSEYFFNPEDSKELYMETKEIVNTLIDLERLEKEFAKKESPVITDPKGELAAESAQALTDGGFEVKFCRIVPPKDMTGIHVKSNKTAEERKKIHEEDKEKLKEGLSENDLRLLDAIFNAEETTCPDEDCYYNTNNILDTMIDGYKEGFVSGLILGAGIHHEPDKSWSHIMELVKEWHEDLIIDGEYVNTDLDAEEDGIIDHCEKYKKVIKKALGV